MLQRRARDEGAARGLHRAQFAGKGAAHFCTCAWHTHTDTQAPAHAHITGPHPRGVQVKLHRTGGRLGLIQARLIGGTTAPPHRHTTTLNIY